jgi:hypothetical protein
MGGGQYDKIIMNKNINLSNDDAVLKILADLLNSLEEAVKQSKEQIAAIVQRAVEEKTSSFVNFGFPKPLRKDGGFEKFLLKVLDAEHSKTSEFEYKVKRNEQNEVVAVEFRGPKTSFNRALRACSWIKQKLLAQNMRK